METVDTSHRLARLRQLMQEHKVDVYIVPSEDAHQSEYIAPCDGRREFISGFSGSAGTAIVSLTKAALSTDGRYFNQAAKQLDSNWALLKQGVEGFPTWQEWTNEQAEGGRVVGVDPSLITPSGARSLSETLKKNGSSLVGIQQNLVDLVWGNDRPAPPREAVRVHPAKYAGKSFQDKVADLRKELETKKAAGFVISMLDEIAWLFNLRGSDIPYNPVFFSYAIITPTTVELYIDDDKLTSEVKAHLGDDVTVKPYHSIFSDAKALGEARKQEAAGATSKSKFLLSNKASWALSLNLGGEEQVEEVRSPIGDAKAVKNDVELAGMRACHIRDGAALIEYFAWLENELVNKKTTLDEVDAADKLEQLRSKQEHYAGLSFDTISSTGPNGAVIHYKPEKGSCAIIDPAAIYLCDSGGQYLDGTTDVTRTFHFGKPTAFEKKAFTLVLKGVISIDTAVFPKGTSGFALDSLARQFLWKEGLDYLHGTGHGVGSYLNVHEGPMGIGTRVQYTEVPIAAGNVLSDAEPGYYEDGKFGIRIENVVVAREVQTNHKFGERPWLGFEHVTMAPVGRNLIEPSLLSDEELKWVNDYHQEIYDKTHHFFENDNGRNPYANGYGYSDSSRYDGGYGASSNNNNNASSGMNGYGAASGGGATRERRPGGYGGFFEPPSQPSSSSLSPGQSPERRRERRDRDDHSSSRSRTRDGDAERNMNVPGSRDGRSRDTSWLGSNSSHEREGDGHGHGHAAGPQAIEDVLQMVQREWDFVADENCIPVQVALQLMDTSTLGKADREPDFIRINDTVQRTLKSVVNEHHQGFNSSIGTYHKIQTSIQSSQSRVRTLKVSLEEAKAGLLSTKPELNGLATSSQKYDDIIQLFSQIQEIQSLPEKLESRISDKRFLAAVEELHNALRLLRRSELENIGALADIRAYFGNQESFLTDILIEELHDHLYLKSPYCSGRWKPPTADGEGNGTNPSSWAGSGSWERPVYAFLGKLDASAPMVEDASRNPEADTFYYIQLLIEALNKMGNLDIAVDRIEQRLPVELFAVVDKTNAEVDARHPNLTRGFASQDSKTNLPTEIIEKRGHVLSEFLWTLYAKFEAIAESHRVVHDVIAGIVDREGIPKGNSLAGGFKELWKLYQSEIRSLMHDYLATDGESSFRPRLEEAEAKRQMFTGQRDKNKKMFKLSETDHTSEIQAEQSELDEILRSSVPGLVTKASQKSAVIDTSGSGLGNSGTGHKILIEPSVFNMSLLLPPSLSFIQRLKEIVPVGSDIAMTTLTSFLDDFLVNVFLPQLDETVTDLCTLSFISTDAFTEDPQWSVVSPRPVFKGTVKFMSIIREFSKMLSSIPHDQAFTQLVLSQIVTYYDKCCGWYKAIVTKISPQDKGEVRLKAAARYAESGDIHDIIAELWNGVDGSRRELIDRETDLLLKLTDEVPLEPYDIISDPKTVASLSLLFNSMQWFASHLAQLRQITQPPPDSRQPTTGPPTRRWTLIGAMKPKYDGISQPVYLPLNQESAEVFDTTVQSLRELASTALFALHVDIRCGIVHMLKRTMAGPKPRNTRQLEPTTPAPNAINNWWHILLNQPTAASPTVLELNNDLIAFDTNISSYLGPAERWFITSGLARFIDRTFVTNTSLIGAMNENGALRLQLDVLVLQQNLKNIIIDPTEDAQDADAENGEQPEVVALPRSAKFLDWFLEGAEKALDYAKDEKESFAAHGDQALAAGNGEPFTYDELKDLIDLCFSDVLLGPRGAENREDFMAAKKASAEALLRLNEVMWDAK
ncbi:hypothetical protein BO70DRAFT_296262 [Aspergillus heteromorphus CBS 117.55]|uniref:Probable Xaa-Pro aminopeptidase P n=1 Tax=Aspergillus heteromorphus CBS 117.55 TaxID=1448321 RepID=A0A317VLE0_9EURO|nr:uncharacterized protein BO70DRAFT_296262 [Aspergillus heteromorphus CBS 117.55]PWY75183.1 hypothetical protein BO70DRAFT_296262 [Aspergillus heteromorphus CBS 117.55]